MSVLVGHSFAGTAGHNNRVLIPSLIIDLLIYRLLI